jgi:hypothetical protein
MDCEKVRDRFSSLLEGELNPLEEEMVRGHLASCEECKKEWERFGQMFRWLHSAEEVEVPEGFLPGIYKKMEERKKKPLWKGFQLPLLKIPVQAVAMVAIVFLALYLTKMMPVETPHKKVLERKEVPYSEVEKREKESVSKEMREEKAVAQSPSDTYPMKYKAEAKPSTQDEEKIPPPAPPPKTEVTTVESTRPKELAKAEPSLLREKKMEKEWVGKGKVSLAAQPLREITLKISDREKTLTQLHELIKKFGGEIVTEEGDTVLASLSISSYSEFEKGLVELSSFMKADKIMSQKDVREGLGLPAGAERKEAEEKVKKPARSAIEKEGYMTIRIILIQE